MERPVPFGRPHTEDTLRSYLNNSAEPDPRLLARFATDVIVFQVGSGGRRMRGDVSLWLDDHLQMSRRCRKPHRLAEVRKRESRGNQPGHVDAPGCD